MTDHAVSRPVADLGDSVADAILDAIDREPDELRERLLAILGDELRREQELRVQRGPTRVLVTFLSEQVQYEIPLVRVPSRGADRLN